MPSLSGNNTNNTAVKTQQQQQQLVTKNIISMSKDEAKTVGRDMTKAVSHMLETSDRCEQDNMEGVEDKDWEEWADSEVNEIPNDIQ